MKQFILIFVLLGLAACAGPVTDAPHAPTGTLTQETRHESGDILEKYVAAQNRLIQAGTPLLLKNAALCPRRALTPGFTVYSDFDLPDALRDTAYERLYLGQEAVVLAVFPGTVAWDKGVRTGDTLLTIGHKRVRNAADARTKLKNIKNRTQETFGFIRNGVSYNVDIPFEPICKYKLIYAANIRDINAYANGKTITVTQGMMDFTNDRELAAVIGHELAHNIMHHISKNTLNTTPIWVAGVLIDGLTGVDVGSAWMDAYTHVWSPRFEREADYVGLYLLARAGGDTSAAATFWRRIAAEHGMTAVKLPTGAVRTHPDSPERFVTLEKTKQEIDEKIRQKQPLLPNLRESFEFGEPFWPWDNPADIDEEPNDEDLNH